MTAPYGNIDRDFDIPALAQAAGATYTARGTAYHAPLTVKLIENGIKNKGFSLVECVTDCPTYYGRKNKKGGAVEMLRYQKENAIDAKAAARLNREDLNGKIVIGELYHEPQPEYTEEYQKIIDRLAGSVK
jgi:2-oxoglutarate ferredoxin oxidoreductase subunit beta